MTAAAARYHAAERGLRPLDMRRDLGGIASLMEICFGDTLDRAGRDTVREMHRLSRAGPLLSLLGAVAPAWQLGFVWIEDGRVIGNISTQPAETDRHVWLIANVAVHPNYRRRRIATALTEAALQLALENGASRAVLQVNQNSTGAQKLYEGLGFRVIAAHTAWERMTGFSPPPLPTPGVETHPARADEWQTEFAFVQACRPAGFSWLHPLCADEWQPSLLRAFGNFLMGQREERWVAADQTGGGFVGWFKIETGFGPMDRIAVVIHPEWRPRLERPLLAAALRRLGSRPWATRLDHPAGEAEALLRDLGFRALQTLVWMRKDFS